MNKITAFYSGAFWNMVVNTSDNSRHILCVKNKFENNLSCCVKCDYFMYNKCAVCSNFVLCCLINLGKGKNCLFFVEFSYLFNIFSEMNMCKVDVFDKTLLILLKNVTLKSQHFV